MDQTELAEKARDVFREYKRRSPDDFMLFVRGLVIPSASGPQRFSKCIAPFQEKCFTDLAPSLTAVKAGTMPPCRRFWIERTKKASKDADLASMVLWLLAFSERPLLVQVSAATQQQAGILKARVEALLHYNEWLNSRVRVVQNRVLGTRLGGDLVRMVIEATGSAGAKQGDTPDVLVLNELVHVDRFAVMETHMNNADGVPQGIVIVSTNAGVKGTRADIWRKWALGRADRWHTHLFRGLAPWLSTADKQEAKARDPIGAEYARLWEGRWISGTGGAVDEDSIDAAFCCEKMDKKRRAGWRYVAGLDLGVSHDHAGIVVIGANSRKQIMRVIWMKGYKPSVPNDRNVLEVDLQLVEDRCLWAWKTWRIECFRYDPAAGGSFMAQRLRKKGVPMAEYTFASPTNLKDMAVAFVTSLRDRKLKCYDDREGSLRRDFGKFAIEHKPPSHYKLIAVSDEFGHADVGTALVIALPRAVFILGGRQGLQAGDSIGEEDETDETRANDSLPPELADICDDGMGGIDHRSTVRQSTAVRQSRSVPDWY